MTTEEELAPLLEELRRTHDVLPFLEDMIAAHEAVFRPLPFEMADLITSSPEFRAAGRRSGCSLRLRAAAMRW